MRAVSVQTADEQTDAVSTDAERLVVGLLAELRHEASGDHGGVESVFVVEALAAHVFYKGAAVRCEATDGGSHVVVHSENLFGGGCELVGGALETTEDNVRLAAQTKGAATLLHGFEGVLDLVQPAVLFSTTK